MTAPVRTAAGALVRIDGRPFVAGKTTETGRIFIAKDSGIELPIAIGAQKLMIRQGRMTSEATFLALDRNAQTALATDWSSFSELEQTKARQRHSYVAAIDNLPAPLRDRTSNVEAALAAAHLTAFLPFEEVPTPRRVRKWFKKWLAAGRDIRVLVPADYAKGNTTPRLEDWVHEEIALAIDETYACDPPGSVADAQERASDRILLRSRKDGLALPIGAKEVVGKNVARRAIAKRSRFELDTVRIGRREAERLAAMVGAGPQAERHLQEVEVDHTPLDVIAVDVDGTRLGRPYATFLVDRHTRMILGFSISFVPPSWVSVMDALQMAVLPKDAVIDWICEGLERPESEWPVHGTIESLFVDRGQEFRSVSMLGFQQALNTRVVDLPPGGPEKKGKIERLFGVMNKRLFHRLPGTTFSSVAQRKKMKHDAEGQACLTLGQIRWIVLHHIVDQYHQRVHTRTGQKPIDRWNASVDAWGPSMPPHPATIAQYVGATPVRKLTKEGVRYETLRWNSNGFQALRDRRHGDSGVVVRIDPNDLKVAWVLDDDVGEWIPGDLVSGDGAQAMTLDEFRHVRKARKAEETFDLEAEMIQARSRQRTRDVVESSRKAPDKRKRYKAFQEDGRKPAEHVRPERHDPEASALPLADHDMDVEPDLATQDARGPWRETVLPPRQPKTPADEPVDVSPPAPLPEPHDAGSPLPASSSSTFKIRRR